MDLLSTLRLFAESNHIPIIRHDSAFILKDKIREIQPKMILELGTAIGYSGLLMLREAPEAGLVTIDNNADYLEMARSNFISEGVLDRVMIIQDDIYQVLPMLDFKVDFIFMDGPKGHYSELFDCCDKLLNVNGGILIDDVAYHGWVQGDDYPTHKHRTIITNMREFLQSLRQKKNYELTSYDLEDGLIFMRKIK